MTAREIHIIGGGLAGSEAAWQAASAGVPVILHEMRPGRGTDAHRTAGLAELVCSNTFKSTETSNAHGLLKAEMRVLGSMVLEAADLARVPGGSALTVDRNIFAEAVTERVANHPSIEIVRAIRDQRRITVIWVEHVMKAVMSLAERVVVLNFGKVLTEGLPQAVMRDRSVVEAYLGTVPA